MPGCPLYSQKRTCSASASRSAKCHKRTLKRDDDSRYERLRTAAELPETAQKLFILSASLRLGRARSKSGARSTEISLALDEVLTPTLSPDSASAMCASWP